MTKTLTEQWREGTLPEGYYYIRWSFNIDDEPSYMIDFYDREDFVDGAFIYKQRKFIDEVMCAVPSYDEYRELLDLNIYEKDRKKVMGLEDKVERLQEQIDELQNENNNLCNDIIDLNLTIENKEKQLDEANEIIQTLYKRKECDGFDHLIFGKYLEKWGVK